jgi:hypothetical protein
MNIAPSTAPSPACPRCGGHDWKRWDQRHPLMIHYMLNPTLCFNELVLGQRLPKVMLTCNTCNEPFVDRSYVLCPACETLHRGRLWSKKAAFAHWFGLVCPSCHSVIPCLWNVWSLLILAVTFPLWYLPARMIKPQWLEFEKKRIARAGKEPLQAASEIPWIALGVFALGGLMWTTFSVGVAVAAIAYQTWTLLLLIPAGIPPSVAGGYLWGLIMKWWMNRTPRAGS